MRARQSVPWILRKPVFELQPMRDTLKERTLGLQYIGAIMIVFGGIALVLAVVGVYGVMALSW